MIKAKNRVKTGVSGDKPPRRQGRPRLGKGKAGTQSPLVGVRLSPDHLATVDKLAKSDGVKRSEMVRRLLLAGIEAHKKG